MVTTIPYSHYYRVAEGPSLPEAEMNTSIMVPGSLYRIPQADLKMM